MGIDVQSLNPDRGGDPEAVRQSQAKRFDSVELVEEVAALYKQWVKISYEISQIRQQVNALQKDIGLKKRNKENADDLLKQKSELDAKIEGLKTSETEADLVCKAQCAKIGNIVHPSVPVSQSEDDNVVVKTYHPDGPNATPSQSADMLSHHEVMYRLEMTDADRGIKVAGHRGFFLTGDGVDLNQALISYGLSFLRERKYKRIQPPFFMKRTMMAKTAQLSEFDESLYKIEGNADDDELQEDDKYLIATSEQPISALHADEWFESPKEQLPIRYAGYSTCFRKEAGSGGRDTWGIFRVHQFEKIEQFCITEPEHSWEMFDSMIQHSEDFYQSLKLPYQLIAIVSGALNNAAAKKYDLEAWFPNQGAYKELVSVSNCTDYQSRALEVRCGLKKQGDTIKKYVHMLNGTLCATERALCCIVENYQTPEGVNIPEVLQPYMQGRTFLPYTRPLPKVQKALLQLADSLRKLSLSEASGVGTPA
ncbi:uncharacterized protein L969DRAFT_104109 [Mixia osmundae IAM 14324]|uniref:serine--tRNA ligase n=1 Tax=Mixia osmundae (strain CBS 9802 / IAM 14324 / JCM 22182 / KY 12970) TaxID=764103 RepID=G7EAM1_MIXOS|nr:uncharacterized protein L969DRAFT_104109 [Mixia osmundae IAM 14324]KEI38200.1 hypothetical protein L969DRAFT_104109 [Mixia osmundae IAM 14324]GAA99881.1 hypothetical protein E5Q_06584 [Mixia osmundae IAM 14324]